MTDHQKSPVETQDVERPVQGGQFEMRYGSDVAAAMLRAFGIDYVALNPGASFRGLHDSLVNYLGNRDPQMLIALHEDHVVSIAHGYAKAAGRPMAAILHSNVGLMHGSMSIFNAWCDRVPILILGATGAVDAAKRRPWIEWIHTVQDQGALVRHFVKWDDQPASPEALVESLLRAWQMAHTAPAGPVYVCLDLGLQEAALEDAVEIPDLARFAPGNPPQPASESLEAAAALLVEAEKPLILAGRMSRDPADWQHRVRLAELLDARVLTDLKSGAAFPTDHPLHPAPPGTRPTAMGSQMVREADVILGLDWIDPGGCFAMATGDVDIDAKFINCTIDAYVHNGWSMDYHILPPTDVRILADPDTAVAALLPEVEKLLSAGPRTSGWKTEPAARGRETGKSELDYHDIADALTTALGDRPATLIRLPLGWPGDALHFRGPLDFLGSDGGAGIGSGPGMAVGAALALKDSDRLPVAILGDGDCLMGINALWSARKYGIPLLVIVANNRSYFNDELHQERVANHRGRPPENRWIGQRLDDPAPDIAALARGFDWQAEGPVAARSDLDRTLVEAVEAVAAGGCRLVDVHIGKDYDAAMVSPGGVSGKADA